MAHLESGGHPPGPISCGLEDMLARNQYGLCYPDPPRDVGALLAAGRRAGCPRPVKHILLVLVS